MLEALLFLIVFSFQANYALKEVYKLEVTWVNPSLLIGVVLLVFYVAARGRFSVPKREEPVVKAGALFVGVYTVSALVAMMANTSWHGGISAPLYAYMREPARCVFCIAQFYLILAVVRRESVYVSVLKSLVWVGLFQLGVAIYLIAAAVYGLPLSSAWQEYMAFYLIRQVMWIGTTMVPRLGGVFREAPIFGLFMLCCLSANLLLLRQKASVVYRMTVGILALGVVACLSDQVLLGAIFLALVMGARRLPTMLTRASVPSLLVGVGAMGVLCWMCSVISVKYDVAATGGVRAHSARGHSMPERIFHTQYGLAQFTSNPVTGIGPGLYGYYAKRTGAYDETVTMQATLPEILVESGILGLAAAALFFITICHKLLRERDDLALAITVSLAVASSLQSCWRWDYLFFTMGLVVVSHRFRRTDPASAAGGVGQ